MKALSAFLFLAAVGFLFCLPLLRKRVKPDENALAPNTGAVSYSMSSAEWAVDFLSRMQEHVARQPAPSPDDLAAWLRHELVALGIDSRMLSASSNGTAPAVYAIVRSRRGAGREAVVLTARYYVHPPANRNATLPHANAAVAAVVSLLTSLKHSAWLAMDVILVLHHPSSAPSLSSSITAPGLHAWLQTNHCALPQPQQAYVCTAPPDFAFSGAIRASFALDIPHAVFDRLEVLSGGVGGDLANLDMVAVVSHVTSYDMRLDTPYPRHLAPPMTAALLRACASAPFSWLSLCAPRFHTSLSNGYVVPLLRMATFMVMHARGSPQPDHALLLTYNIQSVGLRSVVDAPRPAPSTKQLAQSLLSLDRHLEGCVRSINNLLERLHHSTPVYALTGPDAYLPLPTLAIATAAFTALPLLHMALAVLSASAGSPSPESPLGWLSAVVAVLVAYGFGAALYILPAFFPLSSLQPIQVWVAVLAAIFPPLAAYLHRPVSLLLSPLPPQVSVPRPAHLHALLLLALTASLLLLALSVLPLALLLSVPLCPLYSLIPSPAWRLKPPAHLPALLIFLHRLLLLATSPPVALLLCGAALRGWGAAFNGAAAVVHRLHLEAREIASPLFAVLCLVYVPLHLLALHLSTALAHPIPPPQAPAVPDLPIEPSSTAPQ